MLNVCTPSADEQKEIAAALARIPKQPLFAADFEVSHGRSTLTDMPNFLQPGAKRPCQDEPSVASYVRIRREFSVQAMFASVQYSFSNDGQNMVETLVLHVRDPKDLIRSRWKIALRRSAAPKPCWPRTVRQAACVWSALENLRWRWRGAAAREGTRAGSDRLRTAVPQRIRRAGELPRAAGRAHTVPEELAKIRGARRPKAAAKIQPGAKPTDKK